MAVEMPDHIRARGIKAGRAAKAEVRAKRGTTPDDGHRAYRSAYNVVIANYRYAADSQFRQRSLDASARWRARQSA